MILNVIVNGEQRYAYHLLVVIYPHSLHPWHRSERSKSSKCTHCFECLDAPSTNQWSSKIDERNLDTKVIRLVVKFNIIHTEPVYYINDYILAEMTRCLLAFNVITVTVHHTFVIWEIEILFVNSCHVGICSY